ncbi:MAG: hypothetical protein U0800_04770 [Isosphaeraceae bacterium]
MDELGPDVGQDPLVVRDHQQSGPLPLGHPVDPFAHLPDRVDVQAAVGLVEDREGGPEQGHLRFGPLLLAAEALVEVAPGEIGIHAQFVHRGPGLLAELTHRHEVLPLLAVGIADVGHGVTEEVRDGDARD